jgi:hypothetical protein
MTTKRFCVEVQLNKGKSLYTPLGIKSLNPYVLISAPGGQDVWRSKTAWNRVDPMWNQRCEFYVTDIEYQKVKFRVWHEEQSANMANDEPLGECEITIPTVMDEWVELEGLLFPQAHEEVSGGLVAKFRVSELPEGPMLSPGRGPQHTSVRPQSEFISTRGEGTEYPGSGDEQQTVAVANYGRWRMARLTCRRRGGPIHLTVSIPVKEFCSGERVRVEVLLDNESKTAVKSLEFAVQTLTNGKKKISSQQEYFQGARFPLPSYTEYRGVIEYPLPKLPNTSESITHELVVGFQAKNRFLRLQRAQVRLQLKVVHSSLDLNSNFWN